MATRKDVVIRPVPVTHYKCIYCDNIFVGEDSLKHHSLFYCERNDRTFVCPVLVNGVRCGETERDKWDLDEHIVQDHPDADLRYVTTNYYECDLCERRTLSRGHMVDHIQDRIEQNEFDCYLCIHTFKTKREFIKHWKSHTTEESQYICPDNDFTGFNKRELDMHIVTSETCKKYLKYVTICSTSELDEHEHIN